MGLDHKGTYSGNREEQHQEGRRSEIKSRRAEKTRELWIGARRQRRRQRLASWRVRDLVPTRSERGWARDLIWEWERLCEREWWRLCEFDWASAMLERQFLCNLWFLVFNFEVLSLGWCSLMRILRLLRLLFNFVDLMFNFVFLFFELFVIFGF